MKYKLLIVDDNIGLANNISISYIFPEWIVAIVVAVQSNFVGINHINLDKIGTPIL